MRSRVILFPETKSSWVPWFVTLLVTAGLFFATGCGNSPISPIDSGDSNDPLVLGSAANLSSSDNGRSNCYEASGLVTPEDGGLIHLGWAGPGNRLEFAPGAVDSDVIVDVTTCIVKGNPKNHFSVIELDLSPDDLVFDPPAKIVINAGSLNSLRSPKHGGGVVKLFYYDPDTDEWLLQQETKIEKGKVTFSIDHFSKFGISH